jgi:dihydrofolate synthase/folylpolyglutamate synthase
MDHSDFLGDDLLSIAEEKFSVIRNNGLSVFYGFNPPLEKRYEQICKERGSKGWILSRESAYSITNSDLSGNQYALRLREKKIVADIETRIPGLHQIRNSSLAVLASLLIQPLFQNIDLDTIRKGILAAEWPGRMEIIRQDPLVMLDGAHNEQGIQNLTMSLESIFDKQSRQDIVFVYTSMADKDYNKALYHLSGSGGNIILTTVPGNKRCATVENLHRSALLYEWHSDPEEIEDPIQAILWACKRFPVVIICGSLYLVGYIKTSFTEHIDRL